MSLEHNFYDSKITKFINICTNQGITEQALSTRYKEQNYREQHQ